MSLDQETLKDLRQISEENMPETANIFRTIYVPNADGSSHDLSDGQGGIITNPISQGTKQDQRVRVLNNVKCRVTVPRANRSDSEYNSSEVEVSETRVTIIFPWNTPLQQQDRVDVMLRGNWVSFEVQVIAEHSSESVSLQANCVATKVQSVST